MKHAAGHTRLRRVSAPPTLRVARVTIDLLFFNESMKSSTGESNPYHQNGNLKRYHYTSTAITTINYYNLLLFFSNLGLIPYREQKNK